LTCVVTAFDSKVRTVSDEDGGATGDGGVMEGEKNGAELYAMNPR
jgi:hypothetical protein